MILKRLTDYLDSHKIKYVLIQHSPAFTAREVAVSAHIPFREVAKTVVLSIDRKHILAVLPATEMVDLNLLREILENAAVRLTNESEFNTLFPECEIGAMPPLGSLYKTPVYADALLEEDDQIVFQAGTHTEAVKMAWDDYVKLEHPTLTNFGR